MKTDYLEPRAYTKMYFYMSYENALAMRVSLETGLRISDVLNLKPADLADDNTLCVWSQKTKKYGKHKISADLAKRLKQIENEYFIFRGRNPRRARTRQAVWTDVKNAAERLGLKINVGTHSARKTFAVEDFEKNGIEHTQDELQHDNLETTMLYAFSKMLTMQPDPIVTENPQQSKKFAEEVAELVVQKIKELNAAA